MIHSDRSGEKNNDLSGIYFLSDRLMQTSQIKSKNSRIRLSSNEQVNFKSSSRKSSQSGQKQNKVCVLKAIFDFLVPEMIMNKQTCLICEESFFHSHIKEFGSCKHSFCQTCLRQYATIKLNSFQLITCPFEGCNTIMQKNTHLYDNILSQKDKIKHAKIQRELKILANPDLKSCKNQNCTGILNFKQENQQQIENLQDYIKCPQCQLKYCPQCKQQKHEGKCEKFIIKFLEKNKKFRQCNRCKRVIQKSQGCTHMTCLCGYYFCYMCGQQLKGGIHQCYIPQDLNCLQKVRWDIQHKEMFYETNLLSFHRCFYLINFTSQKPLIVRLVISLLYTMTIYPITIVGAIFLATLFLVFLILLFTLIILLLPLRELCNIQDTCVTQTVVQYCGMYSLVLLMLIFYPVFVIGIMIQAIVNIVNNQQESLDQLAMVFSHIGIGLRNVLLMPFMLCLEQQTNG